jgi:hypothetical protein
LPGLTSACRKWVYDSSWVASRKGTDSTLGRLAKLFRMRFFSVNEYGMDAPFRREERKNKNYEPETREAGTTKATAGAAFAVARAAWGYPARSLIKGRL